MILQNHNAKKFNISRVFNYGFGIIFCLLIVVCFFNHPAEAVSVDWEYTGVANTNLNVRTGPGSDYPILYSISAGEEFKLSGDRYSDGTRTYWRISGAQDAWVSRGSNNQHFELFDPDYSRATDTITGIAQDGSISWEHTCSNQYSQWYYHIKVNNLGYTISCDCGWHYDRDAWEGVNWPAEDIEDLDRYIFLGIDTDNDEISDLEPGESIDLLCRWGTNLRPYRIMEFFGTTDNEPPTVTLCFKDSAGNIITEYTFNWWVGVQVETYGIVMVDNRGERVVHPVSDDFMLYCETFDFYLADTLRYYKHGSLLTDDEWHEDGRNAIYVFTIKLTSDEEMNFLDWLIYWTRIAGEWVYDLFDFFGFGDILYGDDSAFIEVFSFDGVQSFFVVIGDFFGSLPPALSTVICISFVGTIIIGILRWFL